METAASVHEAHGEQRGLGRPAGIGRLRAPPTQRRATTGCEGGYRLQIRRLVSLLGFARGSGRSLPVPLRHRRSSPGNACTIRLQGPLARDRAMQPSVRSCSAPYFAFGDPIQEMLKQGRWNAAPSDPGHALDAVEAASHPLPDLRGGFGIAGAGQIGGKALQLGR